MLMPVKLNQTKRQLEELKEVVRAAGSQLVYFPKIVLQVELQLKELARSAKDPKQQLAPSRIRRKNQGTDPQQGYLF